jgi:predicted dehydrogenase
MDKVRVGVVGCGARGRRHLAGLARFADVSIEAICDPFQRNLDVAAQEFKPRGKFTAPEQFLDQDLDAVVVAVPAHLNGKVGADVLRRGFPTLLEKPPGLTSSETRELIGIAAKSGARCMVGLNRRYHPLVMEALEAVHARGPIVQVVAEFHKSMSRLLKDEVFPELMLHKLLLETPIHAIDLARYAAGSPVIRVARAARRVFHQYDDIHAALVEFDNGCVASMTFNYTGDARLERYEFHGDRISAYLDGVTEMEIVADGQRVRTVRSTDSGLANQNRAFIDGVKSGTDFGPAAAGLEEALETMKLSEAIGGWDDKAAK